MRVAVFRAEADGTRTARRLAERGHQALLAPVLRIAPTGNPIPAGNYDAVVFTSAHGVETADPAGFDRLRHLPCFCVGPRTTHVARDRGFADVRTARADAERLTALIYAGLPCGSHVLLVAGRDRKPIVETRLSAGSYRVSVAEVYDAQAVDAWPSDVVGALGSRHVAAALHYSRRSADLVVRRARQAGVAPALAVLAHHCLSGDAAEPLRDAGFLRIVIADALHEDSLLDSLG